MVAFSVDAGGGTAACSLPQAQRDLLYGTGGPATETA